ncbi:retron Ec67 family RNA-directed DNA polymerase/endonuclease [Rhizobium rhizogenes]|uniref:RNA-directed DNA polymerase n=1 Tax=Rhizobium rhizogenes NBRC 13257 TaxID=1220581 RepID=A0AA87U313_RHIRH|nr:retron Ec67 family RNA-directed DNA polymerase/endonuclease [Rhizobium rhizogenes]NTG66706.1 RNA-directed DNA polymerase [Rhizobium rhizogenes]NTI67569.1 RNA-directed DNA polymerase [Rhizobium rhizogenes]TRB13718.1 RNA-directed DNA polymerase [Rhizobium rhizogenes]TRB45650.1 RNA-directed DNA polymerase [Rhizobium rhizogenes]TRB63572.1 RNA-directed DNA polymerase [Rhizobium rhizogenes]
MSDLSALRNATTLPRLARLLKLKGEYLSHSLYWYRQSNPYATFSILKKGGGRRLIEAPNSRLKLVQSRLADLLMRIEAEMENKRTTKARVLAHGFKPGYSIMTNAALHRNKRWVFNIDLKDFFHSINFGRVYGFLLKDRNFELAPKTAAVIAQIACHNNRLPQGSPCSPVISNLIAHVLDLKLNKLANAHRCTYTRYADDITFSTNEKEFPEAVARLVRGSEDKWVAGDKILREVYRAGFKINHDKSRMQRRDSRQDTTGLIVNQKLNVRHEYYKQVRAMCHHLFVHGYAHSGLGAGRDPVKNESVDGMLGFIHQVRSLKNAGFFKTDQPGFSSLYGKFLDYQAFYGILRPRIIGEGKTDNIYIRSAIKRLAGKFPSLIEPSSPLAEAVDFFHYNTRSALFQDLSGGTDEMHKLLSSYRARTSSFKHIARHPVIMVVDNDAASAKIFAHLSNILGTAVGGMDPFYHVYENLYLAPIPKTTGHVAVEDLFDATVLAQTINGRTFNPSNKKFDQSVYYGKNEFATKIVAPQRATIDFTKFEPLLAAFVDIMADYEKRYAGALAALKGGIAAAA